MKTNAKECVAFKKALDYQEGGSHYTTLAIQPVVYCYKNKLTTLEGGPQEVGENFDCSNNQLINFTGIPQKIGLSIHCYRNKLTIEFPKLTTLQLQPYIADEVFINFDREGYNNNRFYAGFEINLTKTIEADIFYMWQSTRSDGGRKDINVLGFKLEIAF